MIKRMIEISKEPVHLSVKHQQLELRPRGEDAAVTTIPCEDIGVLVVDNGQVTYSHHALAALMDCGATVVLCGANHQPAGLLLPFPGHLEVVTRINLQVDMGKPLRKQLWQQLVIAKVLAQAANLPKDSISGRKLRVLARKVRSGDPSNIEAQAAKAYWKEWLGVERPFTRDQDGDGINGMLNYGYAIIRATVARSIVAAGLLPMLGLNHSNRSNAFCLADDLMEPLRPLVDARVQQMVEQGKETVTPETKAPLMGLLNDTVEQGEMETPLQLGIRRMASSYAKCCKGEAEELLIPRALA